MEKKEPGSKVVTKKPVSSMHLPETEELGTDLPC